MIELITKNGKNRGLENWRLSIEFDSNGQQMIVTTENFMHGFRDGEDWDHIATFHNHYGSGGKETRVTYITKNPSKMDGVKDDMINTLYEIIINNIIGREAALNREVKALKKLKNGLNSSLFKRQNREFGLNKVFNELNEEI